MIADIGVQRDPATIRRPVRGEQQGKSPADGLPVGRVLIHINQIGIFAVFADIEDVTVKIAGNIQHGLINKIGDRMRKPAQTFLPASQRGFSQKFGLKRAVHLNPAAPALLRTGEGAQYQGIGADDAPVSVFHRLPGFFRRGQKAHRIHGREGLAGCEIVADDVVERAALGFQRIIGPGQQGQSQRLVVRLINLEFRGQCHVR